MKSTSNILEGVYFLKDAESEYGDPAGQQMKIHPLKPQRQDSL
jgi:hypothetical protein